MLYVCISTGEVYNFFSVFEADFEYIFPTILAMIILIAAIVILILTAFIKFEPTWSKILTAIAFSLLCFGFVLILRIGPYLAATYFYFYIYQSGSDLTYVIPHIGFFLGFIALILGGLILRNKDWEVAK